MFLLFLMGLGTVGVKAQVRIGGNTAPNAAAVLDLNVDDSDAGNKGALALPRVSLANATAPLNGTTPLKGMLVYNTGGSLSAGVYYWDTSKWIQLVPNVAYTMWTKTFDGNLNVPALSPNAYARLSATGVATGDLCTYYASGGYSLWGELNQILVVNSWNATSSAITFRVACYRPSN